MDKIESVWTVKSKGPPDYYLGNDYKKNKQGRLCVESKKYIKEAVIRVESIFGILKNITHPSKTDNNPEIDDSLTLSDKEHYEY